jgi:hypothetical protein
VVLWEPVLSGRAYLAELWRRHLEHLVDTLGHAGNAPHDLAPESMREALGFALPPHFVEQLRLLDAERLVRAAVPRVHVIGPPELLAEWRSAEATDATLAELASPFDWNSEEALNSALVPVPAIQAITDGLAARC